MRIATRAFGAALSASIFAALAACQLQKTPPEPVVVPPPREPTLAARARPAPPARDALRHPLTPFLRAWRSDGAVDYALAEGELVAFRLQNRGPSRANPRGTGPFSPVYREWVFDFRERARQNIFIEVFDFPIAGGRDSHTSMFSHLYFFPRRSLPAIEMAPGNLLVVTLPTGETVTFDGDSGDVIGAASVLREDAPMDYDRDRHRRRFPLLSYHGSGVLVRVDQRGSSPVRDEVWGRPSGKTAEIRHRSHPPCRVPVGALWSQASAMPYFYFATDEEFRRVILEGRCGWHGFRFDEPRDVAAAGAATSG